MADHPRTELVPATGDQQWLSRKQVSKRLRCSLTAVRNLTARGRLTPVLDHNHVWRFNPAQVDDLAIELGVDNADEEAWEAVGDERIETLAARVDLSNSIRLIRNTEGPQRRLVEQLLATNDRYLKRIEHLESKLDAATDARQAAEDRTVERNLLVSKEESRHAMLMTLLQKALEHGERLLTGGGTPFLKSLSPQQASLLLQLRSEFGPEQQEAIRLAAADLGLKPEDFPVTQ
jgi:hypothetical protein